MIGLLFMGCKMNKLEMAQEYIVSEIRRVGVCSMDDEKIKEAWRIADAMQAEDYKRKQVSYNGMLNNFTKAYMNCDIQVIDGAGNIRITTREKEIDSK